MPSINMDPKVRYVTQGAAFDRLLVGKQLTDRRIAQLKKLGWFGKELFPGLARAKRKPKKTINVLSRDFSDLI